MPSAPQPANAAPSHDHATFPPNPCPSKTNNHPMLKNSLTIAWRRLLKQRQFTLLNLLGLSTGLTCTILIYSWATDELKVDRYNKNDARLYQVLLNSPSGDGHDITTADYPPGLLAATLTTQFPEVEAAVPVVPNPWHDKKHVLTTGEKSITAAGPYIGDNFFSIFSFPLIEGNKQRVFHDKNDIVISTDLAKQLFNTTDNLIGKTLRWDSAEVYRISGVFQKPTENATLQFDLAFNHDLFLDKNQKLLDWRNNDPSTYVLLKNGTVADAFNKKIAGLIKSKNSEAKSTLFAQQYSQHYLHGVYENGRP